MKTKVLVGVTNYPKENEKTVHKFVHVRNVYYQECGIDVTVLNFSTQEDYYYENIRVISKSTYTRESKNYDVLIVHQANIRMHYRFLKAYSERFSSLIFFYHGHEVLKINSVYPLPYQYIHRNFVKRKLQDIYDDYKLTIWKHYLPKLINKTQFVFVSKWMYCQFLQWTGIDEKILDGRVSIIYNCVGKMFQSEVFNTKLDKDYDFITIRGNIDTSKYAIDIVNNLAYNTPNAKFLVVGRGEYFQHNVKAPNLVWEDRNLSHDEIIAYLQRARFALMPTRTDAQGLMMCEMAAFGIPVITSNIPVCHEVFQDFDNVYYIDNLSDTMNLNEIVQGNSLCIKDDRFFKQNTVALEVALINKIVNQESGENT